MHGLARSRIKTSLDIGLWISRLPGAAVPAGVVAHPPDPPNYRGERRKNRNPRWGFAAHDRLTVLRNRVRLAPPGTSAYRKAVIRLGRTQVAVAERRRDYLSKIVASLVERFDRIALENVDGRFSRIRASVADAAWGLFRRLLIAKAEATGRLVVLVSARWTTKTCSACGNRNRRQMPLSERQFRCERE